MRKLIITDPAREDLLEIEIYTLHTYGDLAAVAYSNLIQQAFEDIREDPNRLLSKARPEIDGNIRSYHTSSAKRRSAPPVKKPRHFVLYFEANEDAVVISRVLHDERDIERHIPDDHIERSKAKHPSKRKPTRTRER
ncbi:MAG: type II toxin-antitoxin system RelE/ParE family toxin [Pseudomonadota bacterium]